MARILIEKLTFDDTSESRNKDIKVKKMTTCKIYRLK